MIYKIPAEYYRRLHHIRPRFKNDVDGVLLFMAFEISKFSRQTHAKFEKNFNDAIKLYPGNNKLTIKTVNNWRTEISSLFGLIEYDENESWPSRMALLLNNKQDLILFFRYFLYYFQYPGGHLKPEEVLIQLNEGINFKPTKYILNVLIEGEKLLDASVSFGISKEEATHCIFNDLRSSQGVRSPLDTAKLIIKNRADGVKYDSSGDVIRYAGDILDYMVLADLLNQKQNAKFYIKKINTEVVHAFAHSVNYFQPYEVMRRNSLITLRAVVDTEASWFNYVNNELNSKIFETNILDLINSENKDAVESGGTENTFSKSHLEEILGRLSSSSETDKKSTKEIGNAGEAITIEHESNRLTNLGRQDVLHLIKKIPETFAIGYDIGSYEGIGTLRRFIEVKTTISRRKMVTSSFHMTPSEWSSAETTGDRYFIYRLIINAGQIDMFIIQNPVKKYKDGIIKMVPRDGVDVVYDESAGVWEKILL